MYVHILPAFHGLEYTDISKAITVRYLTILTKSSCSIHGITHVKCVSIATKCGNCGCVDNITKQLTGSLEIITLID